MSSRPLPTRPAVVTDLRGFSTRFAVQGDVVLVQLCGELDLSSADRVTDCLASAASIARRAVVVDVSGISFCDPGGLHAFHRGHGHAFMAGVALALAAPSRPVERLLSLCPDTQLPVFATVRAAMNRYAPPVVRPVRAVGPARVTRLRPRS